MSGSGSIGAVVPDVIRRKQSRKLAVVFLLVAVVLAGGGFLVFTQTKTAVSEETADRMQFSAVSQARELSRVSDQLRSQARLLSRAEVIGDNPCPAPGECSEIRNYFENETSKRRLPDQVVGVHYVSTDGRVFESTQPALVGKTFAELNADWATNRTLSTAFGGPGDSLVSPPWRLPANNTSEPEPVFAVLSPVEDRGYLMITVSAERLSEAIPRPGDGGYTVVVDGNGTVVMSHRSEQLLSAFPGEAYRTTIRGNTSPVLQKARNGWTGYTLASPGGNRSAVGYAPVNGTDWVVLTHVPTSQAFAVQNRVLFNLLVLLSIATLALGAVVLTIGRSTTRSLERLSEKANELKEGNLDTDLESDRIDEFGQLYDAFASMRDSLRNRIEEAHEARMEAEQNRQRVEQLNAHLEAKAEEYSSVMESCADGDLTARMDPESDSEAMERIAEEYNEMVDELESTTARLRSFAVDVATASEEVTASVEEVRNASEEVSDTIQVISDGADEQNEMFQTVSKEMSGLSATTEEIASASDEVAEIAERSTQLGREGRKRAQNAIQTMDDVADEADQTVEQFDRLQDDVDRIDDLTEMIAEIADQTNMLALNANIEASRAGEGGEGEGFGAVAEEIKDLAAQAKEAAEEADELIETVRGRTSDTAEVVRRTSQEVEGSVSTIEEAAEALDRLAEHAEMTYTGIQEINNATDQQAASAQQVVALVADAADISDETARESESVAASAEEQTSALTEVTRNVTDLAEQAARLSDRLETFETRSDDDLGEFPSDGADEGPVDDADALEQFAGGSSADGDGGDGTDAGGAGDGTGAGGAGDDGDGGDADPDAGTGGGDDGLEDGLDSPDDWIDDDELDDF